MASVKPLTLKERRFLFWAQGSPDPSVRRRARRLAERRGLTTTVGGGDNTKSPFMAPGVQKPEQLSWLVPGDTRVRITLSDEDIAKTSRFRRVPTNWSEAVVVTDVVSGLKFQYKTAPCDLPDCHCGAMIRPL